MTTSRYPIRNKRAEFIKNNGLVSNNALPDSSGTDTTTINNTPWTTTSILPLRASPVNIVTSTTPFLSTPVVTTEAITSSEVIQPTTIVEATEIDSASATDSASTSTSNRSLETSTIDPSPSSTKLKHSSTIHPTSTTTSSESTPQSAYVVGGTTEADKTNKKFYIGVGLSIVLGVVLISLFICILNNYRKKKNLKKAGTRRAIATRDIPNFVDQTEIQTKETNQEKTQIPYYVSENPYLSEDPAPSTHLYSGSGAAAVPPYLSSSPLPSGTTSYYSNDHEAYGHPPTSTSYLQSHPTNEATVATNSASLASSPNYLSSMLDTHSNLNDSFTAAVGTSPSYTHFPPVNNTSSPYDSSLTGTATALAKSYDPSYASSPTTPLVHANPNSYANTPRSTIPSQPNLYTNPNDYTNQSFSTTTTSPMTYPSPPHPPFNSPPPVHPLDSDHDHEGPAYSMPMPMPMPMPVPHTSSSSHQLPSLPVSSTEEPVNRDITTLVQSPGQNGILISKGASPLGQGASPAEPYHRSPSSRVISPRMESLRLKEEAKALNAEETKGGRVEGSNHPFSPISPSSALAVSGVSTPLEESSFLTTTTAPPDTSFIGEKRQSKTAVTAVPTPPSTTPPVISPREESFMALSTQTSFLHSPPDDSFLGSAHSTSFVRPPRDESFYAGTPTANLSQTSFLRSQREESFYTQTPVANLSQSSLIRPHREESLLSNRSYSINSIKDSFFSTLHDPDTSTILRHAPIIPEIVESNVTMEPLVPEIIETLSSNPTESIQPSPTPSPSPSLEDSSTRALLPVVGHRPTSLPQALSTEEGLLKLPREEGIPGHRRSHSLLQPTPSPSSPSARTRPPLFEKAPLPKPLAMYVPNILEDDQEEEEEPVDVTPQEVKRRAKGKERAE